MEKPKNQIRQLSSQTMVILWALIQSFGWGMIFILLVELDSSAPNPIVLGFIGLFSGCVVGALQHTLIDRGMGIQLKHWLALTAFGTAIGLAALTFEQLWFDSPYLFLLPVFLVPALLQWFSIRRYTRSGWLWVVANGISSMVFVMFLLIIEQQGFAFLSAVIPALLQGIAVGFVMVWLLRRLPKEEHTHKNKRIRYHENVNVSS